ncbi:MAG: hypothetical protein GTO24_06475 [candidate division Zixibacteria bacterium]|nr:hypothetical protein [candidate division Zixibacteria bacterium]
MIDETQTTGGRMGDEKGPKDEAKSESPKLPGLREISEEQLKEILKAHREWVESGEEKGERADLQEAFLVRANLQKAMLIDANLQLAFLSSANLGKARLGGAILRDTDLGNADLYPMQKTFSRGN